MTGPVPGPAGMGVPASGPAGMSAPGQAPEPGVDLSAASFDDPLAQLGRWAKEGRPWDDIEARVYDLFEIPDRHRPAE
ncbi:hypothetical protein R8Z50_34885 [Longispora sp. K20-0274]|uniref:hypothetical protein n=1 Tax=Longispora sp. K20-0274 TaxID=3088255 RepID=UPI003999B688